MAKKSLMNPNNISGELFVDNRCIGCSACVNLAPEVFIIHNDKAYVHTQPTHIDTAMTALLSCPVQSIGLLTHKERITKAVQHLPKQVEDNIYFCGFNARSSYGANSYLIKRVSGNILIDSPRFDPRLIRNLEALGGLKYIYLTHKDDIADYQKFKTHFNAKVIYHEDDFNRQITSADITLMGSEDFIFDDDITIIPVPGHTKGHTVLLYKTSLFTGDHLTHNSKRDDLYAFKNYCWYDWELQKSSLQKLKNYTFHAIFPGHGKRLITTQEDMSKRVQKMIDTL